MATDRPRITPEGLKNLTQTPPPAEAYETGTAPSQRGTPAELGAKTKPTADNMAVPIEPERPEISLEWIAVSDWPAETLAIRDDIAQIETTLKALLGDSPRHRPDSAVYRGAVEMLEHALAARRRELAAEVYRLHGLPPPEEPE